MTHCPECGYYCSSLEHQSHVSAVSEPSGESSAIPKKDWHPLGGCEKCSLPSPSPLEERILEEFRVTHLLTGNEWNSIPRPHEIEYFILQSLKKQRQQIRTEIKVALVKKPLTMTDIMDILNLPCLNNYDDELPKV